MSTVCRCKHEHAQNLARENLGIICRADVSTQPESTPLRVAVATAALSTVNYTSLLNDR